MLHFAFDLVDSGDINFGFPANFGVGLSWNLALFDERLGGEEFDLKHFLEPIFIGPEMRHFRSAIAFNHDNFSQNSLINLGYNLCSCSSTRAASLAESSPGRTGTRICAKTGP